MTHHEIKVTDTVTASDDQVGNVTISMRSYFSSAYLWSAEHHARLAQQIEDQHDGPPTFSIRHRAHIIDAVTDAVAFVEAAVNEVAQDVADGHGSYVEPLNDRARDLINGYWVGASEASTLAKYRDLLAMASGKSIDEGSEPAQGMRVLVRLRNHLVHFKPSNASADYEPSRLEKQLKGRGYPDNSLMHGSGNAWFPDHALSAGCARWACDVARDYVSAWCAEMGLTLHFQIVDWGEEP